MIVLGSIILTIVGLLLFFAYCKHQSEQEEREAKQRELDRPKNGALFFDRCVEAGFLTIGDSLETKDKIRKIAIDCNLLPENTSILSGKNFVMLRDVFQTKKESDEGRKKLGNKQKELEKAAWARLTAYADLPPEDKLQTMAANYIQRQRGGSPTKLIQPQKTSDGMVMAGVASGIGGPIPALASLSRTAERNAQVEEYNQGVNAINSLLVSSDIDAKIRADKTEEMAKRFTGKKIADMPKEEVLEHLHFSKMSVSPYSSNSVEYNTGTLAVTVEMEPVSIEINDISYFVDGSLTAEIFDENEKVGEAALVLPMCGSNLDNSYLTRPYVKWSDRERGIKLEGICLNCKAAEDRNWMDIQKWKVKIVPGKYLWAMEDLSAFDKSQIRNR